jgi:hypothetical protein
MVVRRKLIFEYNESGPPSLGWRTVTQRQKKLSGQSSVLIG